jgi:hypothetical protein
MRTLTFLDLEKLPMRIGIYGLLPTVATLLTEWNPKIERYVFGFAIHSEAASGDDVYDGSEPIVSYMFNQRQHWQICADDDGNLPSFGRLRELKQRASAENAEFSVFDEQSFRRHEQRFVNCLNLNAMAHAASTDRFNCHEEKKMIRDRCRRNGFTCLLELQQIPDVDVGKMQASVAQMIRDGELATELDRRHFSLVSVLKPNEKAMLPD